MMPSISTKIAGVTFPNADGQQRQDLMAWIEVGHDLVLEREPGNTFDPNAVKVMHPGYGQLGYLPRKVAEVVAGLELQFPLSAVVTEVWTAKRIDGKDRPAGAEIKFETPETSRTMKPEHVSDSSCWCDPAESSTGVWIHNDPS